MIARRRRLAFIPAGALIVAIIVAGCGMPGPSPTPPPTSSPVQPSPNPGLVEFTAHIRDAASVRGELVRDLAEASAASQQQLALAAGRLEDWARGEQAWLDEHPADACFAEAWAAYAAGVEDFKTAASDLAALAAAPSPPTDAEAQNAAGALGSGSESFDVADELADAARATCR